MNSDWSREPFYHCGCGVHQTFSGGWVDVQRNAANSVKVMCPFHDYPHAETCFRSAVSMILNTAAARPTASRRVNLDARSIRWVYLDHVVWCVPLLSALLCKAQWHILPSTNGRLSVHRIQGCITLWALDRHLTYGPSFERPYIVVRRCGPLALEQRQHMGPGRTARRALRFRRSMHSQTVMHLRAWS